jgi:hypothetical protein
MSALVALSVGFARSWVSIYTLGLPAAPREARRSEIDSDLWEQQWLASRRGDSVAATAGEIATRTLFGIIDDISWRLESGASSRTKGIHMNDTWPMRIGFLLALVLLAMVARIAFFGSWEDSESLIWRVAFFVCPVVAAVGLVLCRSKPVLGLGLVAAGAISSALLMFWMAFITVPLALAIIVFAAFRAGFLPRPSRQQPA